MPKATKNTDFLMISGRIKSREIALMDTQAVDKLIEAPDAPEVLKLLTEHGYELAGLTGEERDFVAQLVERDRAETATLVAQAGRGMFDCFLYPHDYHNIKVALKNELLASPLDIYIEGGSIKLEALLEAVKTRELGSLTELMSAGITEALDLLNRTSNSQYIDIVLDRYCFLDMGRAAAQTGNSFLAGYVRRLVDVANIKALLRLRKMEKNQEFASKVFFEGGTVAPERFTTAFSSGDEELSSALPGVADLLQKATGELRGGGGMSAFEQFCDNYLMEYVKQAKYVSFGAEVPMAYLLAKEAEYKVISIVLAGRSTGLNAASIKERLRELYV